MFVQVGFLEFCFLIYFAKWMNNLFFSFISYLENMFHLIPSAQFHHSS